MFPSDRRAMRTQLNTVARLIPARGNALGGDRIDFEISLNHLAISRDEGKGEKKGKRAINHTARCRPEDFTKEFIASRSFGRPPLTGRTRAVSTLSVREHSRSGRRALRSRVRRSVDAKRKKNTKSLASSDGPRDRRGRPPHAVINPPGMVSTASRTFENHAHPPTTTDDSSERFSVLSERSPGSTVSTSTRSRTRVVVLRGRDIRNTVFGIFSE